MLADTRAQLADLQKQGDEATKMLDRLARAARRLQKQNDEATKALADSRAQLADLQNQIEAAKRAAPAQ